MLTGGLAFIVLCSASEHDFHVPFQVHAVCLRMCIYQIYNAELMALDADIWRCTRTFQQNASMKTHFKEVRISLVSIGISGNPVA